MHSSTVRRATKAALAALTANKSSVLPGVHLSLCVGGSGIVSDALQGLGITLRQPKPRAPVLRACVTYRVTDTPMLQGPP